MLCNLIMRLDTFQNGMEHVLFLTSLSFVMYCWPMEFLHFISTELCGLGIAIILKSTHHSYIDFNIARLLTKNDHFAYLTCPLLLVSLDDTAGLLKMYGGPPTREGSIWYYRARVSCVEVSVITGCVLHSLA